MPELRWILLILGLLFVAALAWWELRRQRRLPDPHQTSHFREPTLTLPEIRPREPPQALPVVDFTDDSLLGLRVDGVRIEEDMAAPEVPPADVEVVVPETEVEPPATPVAPPPSLATIVPEPPLPPEPIVEWPPEEERKLIALRLIAQSGARFPGRALRQALAAEGFMLGKLAIFHKSGPGARAVVSAASLTQPGSFDLDTMDTQRYAGLSLFAVLPGPLPAPQMFDELIAAARSLNDRLQGTLQDEQGEPLTATRSASLRESLAAEPPA